MGVLGWNRLLEEHGYLPDHNATNCCSTSLWNDDPTTTITGNTNTAVSQQPPLKHVKIERKSEFHVDGYGLCYHIIATAYARHINAVLHVDQNQVQRPCVHATSITRLSSVQARHLNPNFAIPNKLIHDVTEEFINTIKQCKIKMTVYWDGPQRYIHKQNTDQKRNIARYDTYVNLHQYCTNGTLPDIENTRNHNRNKLCQYMLNNFPPSKLGMTQIYHTLHVQNKIQMVNCNNEADGELAHAVQGNPKAYILGFDSDFCFYKQIQYIPIPTMQIQQNNHGESHMMACVISREMLASTLNLPDSNSMIEVAILLGNDYIDPTLCSNNHQWNNEGIEEQLFKHQCSGTTRHGNKGMGKNKFSLGEIVSYVQNQNPGFHLSSSIAEVDERIKFIRQVYNLQLHQASGGVHMVAPTYYQDDLIRKFLGETNLFSCGIQRPIISSEAMVAMDLKIPQQKVPSKKCKAMKKVIASALRNYVEYTKIAHDGNQNEQNQSYINVTEEHLIAIETLNFSVTHSHDGIDKFIMNNDWRPLYQDTFVVALIEKIIMYAIENNFKLKLIQATSPFMYFNPYAFYIQLMHGRQKNRNRYAHPVISSMPPASATAPGRTQQRSTKRKNKEKQFINEKKIHEDNDNDDGDDTSTDRSYKNESMICDEESKINDEEDEDRQMQISVQAEPRLLLPVDEFEKQIIQSVHSNRVTIIQGETGCGKSSRIPIMLLRAPLPPGCPHQEPKMFVSQPRRIAVKGLVERLREVEPDFRDFIALRMGHGVREYVTNLTRATFVTTGYLVQLMANMQQAFADVTYLIIDEVHERSVDTDILCLLCKRFLQINDHARLIVMSATLATSLYQEYFGVSVPAIKVGGRRFPVKEVYLSDLNKAVQLGSRAKYIKMISKECLEKKCNAEPSILYLDNLRALAAHVAIKVGKTGSSVLIFVSGMTDIVVIKEIIDKTIVPGTVFRFIPIHSDIPFEDQMTVFDSTQPNEVKIIVATNAAESSLTLPDVDSVICCGLCKQLEYNPASHRQMLSPAWISRASATQRAGRTGRLRPGTVYRLYEVETFTTHMKEYEEGEMLRVPLDNVILQLKQLIRDEKISDVLASCLESPKLRTIDRSFESLHSSNFISTPLDDKSCDITRLGHFVSKLGIDLSLGALIGLGIQFGVGVEAIQLAGVLSFAQSPWRKPNLFNSTVGEFNSITAKTFVSRCYFDANLFSEPMAVMNLLWEYNKIPPNNEKKWSAKHGICLPLLKQLNETCFSLKQRVADFMKIPINMIEVSYPPRFMPHATVTILRILQAWVFHDSILQFDPKSIDFNILKDEVVIPLLKKSDCVEKKNLDQIYPESCSFSLIGASCVERKGSFPLLDADQCDSFDILEYIQNRLISYSTEKEMDVIMVMFRDSCTIYMSEKNREKVLCILPERANTNVELTTLSATRPSKVARGRGERPCGMHIVAQHHDNSSASIDRNTKLWSYVTLAQDYNLTCFQKFMEANLSTKIFLNFHHNAVVDSSKIKMLNFMLMVEGTSGGISDLDLKDLFSPGIQAQTHIPQISQKIVFPVIPDAVISDGQKTNNSINQPLMECVPEGVRLLSVLASSWPLKEGSVFLSTEESKKSKGNCGDQNHSNCGDQNHSIEQTLMICMDPKTMNIKQRWKRFDAPTSKVFVNLNSVVGTAVPLNEKEMLYCTCSNTLELRNGHGLLATGGLTLLPPGKLFIQLCRFTFGQNRHEDVEDGSYVEKTIQLVDPECSEGARSILEYRLKKAVEFNESSISMGEQLHCFPEKIKMLLDIFNGVDGCDGACRIWEEFYENPFLIGNLEKARQEKRIELEENELEQRMSRLLFME